MHVPPSSYFLSFFLSPSLSFYCCLSLFLPCQCLFLCFHCDCVGISHSVCLSVFVSVCCVMCCSISTCSEWLLNMWSLFSYWMFLFVWYSHSPSNLYRFIIFHFSLTRPLFFFCM